MARNRILGLDVMPREGFRSILTRYASTLAVVAIAILLRVWLNPYLGGSSFAIFLGAILMGGWVGGLGPSLLGQTLILIAEASYFKSPTDAPEPSLQAVISIGAFYLVGGSVGVLSDLRRAASRHALMQQNEATSQREQLRATFSCMGDGVVVSDAQGRLTLMNPVAEAMTGWSIAEAAGKPVCDILAICDELSQQVVESPIKCVLREGTVLHEVMRLILTTRNEQTLPVAYSAAPVRDSHGNMTGVVLVFRDESERRRTEQALRTADQRKDEFLATLAHELRNPLAPITMGLELMKMSGDDGKTIVEVRGMMERQTQHMVRLIDDLLDVSRITRGKLELRKRPVDLAEAVRDAIDAAQPLIDGAPHRLTVTLPDRPLLIHADPNRLTQVLANLLNNAAKYTPPGGRIELAVAQTGGEVTVRVTDSGQGIAPEMLGDIFEMFTQVESSKERGHQGLGIGLTLAKRLIELHDGTIEAQSEGLNRGSSFEVRLPVLGGAPAQEISEPLPIVPAIPLAKRKVLIVDDNDDALNTLGMLVKSLGAEACEARDGLKAIETGEEFLPEIILMDLGMPNLNGFEAAERIRTTRWGKDVVLVATTGWGQQEDRRRTREAGFDHHLVKPIELGALREILQRVRPMPALSGPLSKSNGRQSTAVKKSAETFPVRTV